MSNPKKEYHLRSKDGATDDEDDQQFNELMDRVTEQIDAKLGTTITDLTASLDEKFTASLDEKFTVLLDQLRAPPPADILLQPPVAPELGAPAAAAAPAGASVAALVDDARLERRKNAVLTGLTALRKDLLSAKSAFQLTSALQRLAHVLSEAPLVFGASELRSQFVHLLSPDLQTTFETDTMHTDDPHVLVQQLIEILLVHIDRSGPRLRGMPRSATTLEVILTLYRMITICDTLRLKPALFDRVTLRALGSLYADRSGTLHAPLRRALIAAANALAIANEAQPVPALASLRKACATLSVTRLLSETLVNVSPPNILHDLLREIVQSLHLAIPVEATRPEPYSKPSSTKSTPPSKKVAAIAADDIAEPTPIDSASDSDEGNSHGFVGLHRAPNRADYNCNACRGQHVLSKCPSVLITRHRLGLPAYEFRDRDAMSKNCPACDQPGHYKRRPNGAGFEFDCPALVPINVTSFGKASSLQRSLPGKLRLSPTYGLSAIVSIDGIWTQCLIDSMAENVSVISDACAKRLNLAVRPLADHDVRTLNGFGGDSDSAFSGSVGVPISFGGRAKFITLYVLPKKYWPLAHDFPLLGTDLEDENANPPCRLHLGNDVSGNKVVRFNGSPWRVCSFGNAPDGPPLDTNDASPAMPQIRPRPPLAATIAALRVAESDVTRTSLAALVYQPSAAAISRPPVVTTTSATSATKAPSSARVTASPIRFAFGKPGTVAAVAAPPTSFADTDTDDAFPLPTPPTRSVADITPPSDELPAAPIIEIFADLPLPTLPDDDDDDDADDADDNTSNFEQRPEVTVEDWYTSSDSEAEGQPRPDITFEDDTIGLTDSPPNDPVTDPDLADSPPSTDPVPLDVTSRLPDDDDYDRYDFLRELRTMVDGVLASATISASLSDADRHRALQQCDEAYDALQAAVPLCMSLEDDLVADMLVHPRLRAIASEIRDDLFTAQYWLRAGRSMPSEREDAAAFTIPLYALDPDQPDRPIKRDDDLIFISDPVAGTLIIHGRNLAAAKHLQLHKLLPKGGKSYKTVAALIDAAKAGDREAFDDLSLLSASPLLDKKAAKHVAAMNSLPRHDDVDDDLSDTEEPDPDLSKSWRDVTVDPNAPPELRDLLLAELEANGEIFDIKPDGLPTPALDKHGQPLVFSIQLRPNACLDQIRGYATRLSPEKQTFMDTEIARMHKANLFERCPSSPVRISPVIPRQRNGLRFCFDFSQLNKQLQGVDYAMPDTTEMASWASQCYLRSQVDMKKQYWQAILDPDCRFLTQFHSRVYGMLQATVAMFGISTLPAFWQKHMDDLLQECQQHVRAYMDDCVGRTDPLHPLDPTEDRGIATPEQRLQPIIAFLRISKQFGLTFGPSKSFFLCETIEFLGHLVSTGSMQIIPARVEAFLQRPDPVTAGQVVNLISAANFYRGYIPDFSDICAPLDKCRTQAKSTKIDLADPAIRNAIDALKNGFAEAHRLYPPPPHAIMHNTSDYSQNCHGGAAVGSWFTSDDLRLRPFAFVSKKWPSVKSRYSAQSGELTAAAMLFRRFPSIYQNRKTFIRSDNSFVISCINNATGGTNERERRAIQLINTFDVFAYHAPGVSDRMSLADFGSRDPRFLAATDAELRDTAACPSRVKQLDPIPIELMSDTEVDINDISPSTATIAAGNIVVSKPMALQIPSMRDQWNQAVADDETIAHLRPRAPPTRVRINPNNNRDNRKGIAYKDQFGITRIDIDATASHPAMKRVIVVPQNRRNHILRSVHASHSSADVMIHIARPRYFWPNMHKEIRELAQRCEICILHRNFKQDALLEKPINLTAPFQAIQLDHRSLEPNKQYLETVDLFSGLLDGRSVPNLEAKTAIYTFERMFISKHGAPLIVSGDQAFFSSAWQEYALENNIVLAVTPPHTTQPRGKIERAHAVVARLTSKLTRGNGITLDEAYEDAINETNKLPGSDGRPSPYEITYVRTPLNPSDAFFAMIQKFTDPRQPTKAEDQYLREAKERRAHVIPIVRKMLDEQNRYARALADVRHQPPRPYKVGDLVMLNVAKNAANKFEAMRKWAKPLRIRQISENGTKVRLETLTVPPVRLRNAYSTRFIAPLLEPPSFVEQDAISESDLKDLVSKWNSEPNVLVHNSNEPGILLPTALKNEVYRNEQIAADQRAQVNLDATSSLNLLVSQRQSISDSLSELEKKSQVAERTYSGLQAQEDNRRRASTQKQVDLLAKARTDWNYARDSFEHAKQQLKKVNDAIARFTFGDAE